MTPGIRPYAWCQPRRRNGWFIFSRYQHNPRRAPVPLAPPPDSARLDHASPSLPNHGSILGDHWTGDGGRSPVFRLQLTQCGIPAECIKFNSSSMESDKFITVCDQTQGSTLWTVDLSQGNNVKKRSIQVRPGPAFSPTDAASLPVPVLPAPGTAGPSVPRSLSRPFEEGNTRSTLDSRLRRRQRQGWQEG